MPPLMDWFTAWIGTMQLLFPSILQVLLSFFFLFIVEFTNCLGNITIICEANTLSCPVFHIESDFTDKVVNVYPFSHIFQTLKKNTATGDLLQNAYDQFGQGVIDGDFDQVTLDSMSAALAQVSDVVSENCVDPKVFLSIF